MRESAHLRKLLRVVSRGEQAGLRSAASSCAARTPRAGVSAAAEVMAL